MESTSVQSPFLKKNLKIERHYWLYELIVDGFLFTEEFKFSGAKKILSSYYILDPCLFIMYTISFNLYNSWR